MRVFVTGGTGFIGRHLIPRLLERGHRVVALVRRPADADGLEDPEVSRSFSLLPWDGPGVRTPGVSVEWVVGDVGDPTSYRDALRGCDALVHLAPVGPAARARSGSRGDADPTARLLGAAADSSVPHVVAVSALGADPESPSPFLRSKGYLEELLRGPAPYARTVVRPSLVFGPGDRFVSALEACLRVLPAAPDPAGIRLQAQPIWVDDLALSLCTLLESPPSGWQVVEAGGPDILSFSDLVDLIGAAMGRPPRRVSVPWPLARAVWHGTARGTAGGLHPGVFPLLVAGATCSPGPFRVRAGLERLLPFGPAIRRYVESV